MEIVDIQHVPFEVNQGLFTLVPDMGWFISVFSGAGKPADLGGDGDVYKRQDLYWPYTGRKLQQLRKQRRRSS